MKFKNIYLAVLSTSLVIGVSNAEPEVSGKITYENASFSESGNRIGGGTHGKVDFKSEVSARVYIDGTMDDEAGSAYHIELQGFNDGQALSDYQNNESYTQRDALREAYIDTTLGDSWAIRAGKQQTVWGTADGMKLLDTINPTDYSEFAQNQMEDSRIPVWMLNAEKTNESGSNFQVILSEAKSNFIPGFSTINDGETRSRTVTRSGGSFGTRQSGETLTNYYGVDQGHQFIMKGVDSISGKSNGILNILPQMGIVADTFAAGGSVFTSSYSSTSWHLENWSDATVEEFINADGRGALFGGFCPGYLQRGISTPVASGGTAYCLQEIAYDTNQDRTNLLSGITTKTGTGEWDQTTPDTVFEYLPDATFKTFASMNQVKTKYIREGAQTDANLGLRYKNTTDSGVNYSLNYMRGADPNPHIELEWQNSSGEVLTATESTDTSNYDTGYRSIVFTGGSDSYYGSKSNGIGSYVVNPVTLVLKEKNATIQNIGGSFDTTIDTNQLGPVVIRGEALYQKDVRTQIIDKAKMSIGNISEAFTTQKGDRFKYVLGADITALTNMMVSLQFIQDRNLDYVDTTTTLANAGNYSGTAFDTDVVGARYTADTATMSMQNQYQKAEKNKEFYSLFLSKPYGESGQHRWNNIFIFEENGGKWNRLDTEYTIDDNTVATAEWNRYWGDENTQFGQLKKSSNIQLGIKYTF
jgi:hypothetical protein